MPNRQLIFTFVLVFLAGFLVWLLAGKWPQKVEIDRQVSDIKARIDSLAREEERQKNRLEYLNSESYLEKQARLRLNLKKEGEEVVFIYRKDDDVPASESFKETENPVLLKLKEWFKIIWPRE